jgi:hypothetical protein
MTRVSIKSVRSADENSTSQDFTGAYSADNFSANKAVVAPTGGAPALSRAVQTTAHSQVAVRHSEKKARTTSAAGLKFLCATPAREAEALGPAGVLLMFTVDADHWRRRADEMRRIAETITIFPNANASVLRTAEEYDRLAERAQRRASRLI